ncbi:MAG: hypothetical protein ACI841_001169, partial [Planctomycetota bacterium]
MKRILILYPGLAGKRADYLAPHRWKLWLAGFRLVLADDQVVQEDSKIFEDCLPMPVAEDVTEGWSRLRRYLDTHRIDAILAQSEPSLFLAGLAAEHLGIPGPSLAGSLATTSKWISRSKLAAVGVPQPKFTLTRDAAQALHFAEHEAGWPIVLKAVASTRQRLVTVVRSPKQLQEAVACVKHGIPESLDVKRLVSFCELTSQNLDCDPLKDFLVESFAAGAPFETEGMVQNGKPHSMGIVEQMQPPDDSFFIDGYLLPAEFAADESKLIEDISARALKALGVDSTGYSIEFRRTETGPVVIEVNGRLGWDEGLGELFAAAGTTLPAISAAKLALGRKLGDLRPKRSAAVAYHSQLEAGIVREVSRIPRKPRGVHSYQIHVEAGELLKPIGDPDSRPHLVHVLATDRASSHKAYATARGFCEIISQ